MKRYFPEIIIRPVQLLDRPQVYPRAAFRFQTGDELEGPASHCVEMVMDFFEPPIHVRLLPKILAERAKINPATGRVPSYKHIAAICGTSVMTIKRALNYARLMQQEGLSEPFRVLLEAPARASRWRNRDKGGKGGGGKDEAA